MRVILIGNYQPDKQESMERFALLLQWGFKEAGIRTEIWRPKVFFGRWTKSTNKGIGKWLGYMDKWLLFPLILRLRLKNKSLKTSDVRFHVCDHSNAPYLGNLPADRTAITCHDVLAIRGALGFEDAYCPASTYGKMLQKWILQHLSQARLIGCNSSLVLKQLIELLPANTIPKTGWRTVLLGLNADFSVLDNQKINTVLNKLKIDSSVPYLLHVGSSLQRKNRKLLLDMVYALGDKWTGNICYAGEAIDDALNEHAKELGLQGRVISVVRPDHETLQVLYNACEAFIFPSFSEGFGWPLIEGQACGVPVITSNIDPMPEVSNGTALHADPTKPQEFADAFLLLQDESFRAEIIKKGFENIARFKPVRMINDYLKLHGLEQIKNKDHVFESV